MDILYACQNIYNKPSQYMIYKENIIDMLNHSYVELNAAYVIQSTDISKKNIWPSVISMLLLTA